MHFIFETVFKDGVSKWRIMNLNEGSIYPEFYNSEEEALNNIKHGETRGHSVVRRICRHDLFWQAFIRQ